MKLALAILALALPGIGSAGQILTMTFDGLVAYKEYPSYSEGGITAMGTLSAFNRPASMDIEASGSGWRFPIDFTTGSLFTPISVDLMPHGSGYCAACTSANEGPGRNDPMPYIWFSGFRDGELVSSISLSLAPSDVFSPLSLSLLGEIDTLEIEAKNVYDLGLPGSCWINWGCGWFTIDNLVLENSDASVPEPATLGLLALGALGVMRIRRAQRALAS